jgi:hypothetical protein
MCGFLLISTKGISFRRRKYYKQGISIRMLLIRVQGVKDSRDQEKTLKREYRIMNREQQNFEGNKETSTFFTRYARSVPPLRGGFPVSKFHVQHSAVQNSLNALPLPCYALYNMPGTKRLRKEILLNRNIVNSLCEI